MEPKKIVERFDGLKGDRGTWENHWQQIAEVMRTSRADFVGERAIGEKRNQRVYDSTGRHVNERLASGLHGMLTNPASKWFGLRVKDDHLNESGAVKQWLAQVERIMYGVFNDPDIGFTSQMHELYLDLPAFGTATMFIGSNQLTGKVLFQTRHLGECMIEENAHGLVDTVYRKFKRTSRQMIQEWGIDNVSDDVRKCFEKGKLDEKFEIIHAVHPRTDYNPRKTTKKDKPVASVYIEVKALNVLHDGGFDEMPYVTPRWSKNTGERYGRGPGMATLEDVQMLQEMMKTIIKGAQKAVLPPLQVPDDGLLSPVRTQPGGLTYRRSGSDAIQPLNTGTNVPLGIELMEEVRNRIRESFFVDQLQLLQAPNMTATEVLQRTEEKLRLMGPVLGRLQAELLGPMIDRVWGILERAGALPSPPPEAEGQLVDIQYVSPIARAQRQQEVQGILRTLEVVPMVANFQPDSVNVIDGKRTIAEIAELFGADTKMLRADEEVQQIEARQAEQAQQQQQLDALQQAGPPIRDLAQAAQMAEAK